MNGSVINHILSTNTHTNKWYNGFSSPDIPLPNIKKYPSLVILNTDTTDGPGEHWCVLIIYNRNKSEFFDSYGQSPSFYHFDKPIFEQVNNIQFNNVRVQGSYPTCGHHCLFFSILRAAGHSMKNILLNKYSNHLLNNDQLVYNFIKNSYGNLYAQFDV